METKTYISVNLKFLRNKKNMTQEQLGKICNKSNSAISNYELGTREIEAVDLIKIANYFNLTLDDLITKDLRMQESSFERISVQEAKEEIERLINMSDMSEQQKAMIMTPLNYISEEVDKDEK